MPVCRLDERPQGMRGKGGAGPRLKMTGDTLSKSRAWQQGG